MSSILVVDDDADARDAVAKFLQRSGYAVRSAPNGRLALIAVATAVPDAIVLDVMMPEMNGVEFVRVIRSYLRWAEVPVIVLTAYGEGPHIDALSDLGARCVLRKASYTFDDLLACVRRVLADPAAGCG